MAELNDNAPEVQPIEDDVDTLLEGIEQAENKQAAAPPEQKIEEYTFIHNGKEVKGDIEKLKRWASQGYDAPNRLGELNKKISEYSQREAQLKELEQKYKPVNEFVQKNPELYQKLYSEYEQSQASQPLAALEPIKAEIAELKNERLQEKVRQEDELYQKELTEIKKSYPKVDFDSKDQFGKSLEHQVLQYAVENGIKKFTTAFRDFYHDNLLKMAEESAKEKVVASKQMRTKQGILDIASYPSRKPSNNYDKTKTWNDVLKEAIDEYT